MHFPTNVGLARCGPSASTGLLGRRGVLPSVAPRSSLLVVAGYRPQTGAKKGGSTKPVSQGAKEEGTINLDALLGDKAGLRALRQGLSSEMAALQEKASTSTSSDSAGDEVSGENERPPSADERSQSRSSRAPKPTGASGAVDWRKSARDRGKGGSSERKPLRTSPKLPPTDADVGGALVVARVVLKAGKARLFAQFGSPVGFGLFIVGAVLKAGKARLFAQHGSPVVYSGAIDRVNGRPPPSMGDAVVLCDENGCAIGWGVFNEASMFRVRIMQLRSEYESDEGACFLKMPELIKQRVEQAVSLRSAIGLPSEQTTVYRLINSEGDRLSGVIADVLGSVIVVQSVAGWAERYRLEVEASLRECTGLEEIVWRPNFGILKEEGIFDGSEEGAEENVTVEIAGTEDEAGDEEVEMVEEVEEEHSGDEPVFVVVEAGIKYNVSSMGQKTGFYADQRDSRKFLAPLCKDKKVLDLRCNSCDFSISALTITTHHQHCHIRTSLQTIVAQVLRRSEGQPQVPGSPVFYADQRDSRKFLAPLCKDKKVLDLCCYSGGFSIAAALAGAESVIGVDSSAVAIELASSNANLNGVEDKVQFVKADVTDHMKEALEAGLSFDIVVLDPPKLAPNKNALRNAKYKYNRLNVQAMQLVKPGGILMTCSCSGAMTQSGEFKQLISEAARQAGRRVTLLRQAGAAQDHPLDLAYPEGEYLTNLTLLVS
eukprot:gene7610-764_t